jgi:hypothetical protein
MSCAVVHPLAPHQLPWPSLQTNIWSARQKPDALVHGHGGEPTGHEPVPGTS